MQVWPQLRNLVAIAPAMALSRLADLKTMNGAFPPSSSPILLIPSAHCRYRSFPTSVEPVKDIPATLGLLHNNSPTEAAWARLDVITLMTPGGNPASSANFTKAKAVNGVSSAGLMTTVQPKNSNFNYRPTWQSGRHYLQPMLRQLSS